MQKAANPVPQDYGTNCNDCERYRQLGDVCLVEHEKKFVWEYCRDFVPQVVLPDYKELMRSVRQDRALEKQKLREKKERERKKKLKEKMEREAFRKKERRARLRRLRDKEKKKMTLALQRNSEEPPKHEKRARGKKRISKNSQPELSIDARPVGTNAATSSKSQKQNVRRSIPSGPVPPPVENKKNQRGRKRVRSPSAEKGEPSSDSDSSFFS